MMQLEVGKRYVLRNGEVTSRLRYVEGNFPFRSTCEMPWTWQKNGRQAFREDEESPCDIVAEYVEPQPAEPLRWVENCKPDKPGIWASMDTDGGIYVESWTEASLENPENFEDYATDDLWCYLGPIPEILPPVKKVVQRLWLEPSDVPSIAGLRSFIERWMLDNDAEDVRINNWIRTNETREVEQ